MVPPAIGRAGQERHLSALAEELRDLAAWADVTSRWLEAAARQANDHDDPKARTVVFDAAVLDDFLTGFRGVPGVIEAIAANLERQPAIRVITGGRR
jgi:hypothetical protein